MSPHLVLLTAWIASGGLQGTTASLPETQSAGGVTVEPAVVTTGIFYHGATVRVSAVVPAGAGVALACSGATGSLTLNRKGKRMGVVWMNVGQVSWGRIPDLYLLHTSQPSAELGRRETLRSLGVGLDAVRDGSAPGPGADPLFGELVKLKEREGLWSVTEGSVEVRPRNGCVVATADLALPTAAPPGVYRIRVYAFVEGRGELVGTGDFSLRQGGLPAFISDLATTHGLLYGILAVTVAVGVGLLTGVVFGLGSRGGH